MGPPDTLRDALGKHRPLLFGMCYRMLGSRADAEDMVQETFERALRHPPADLTRELRPWLSRVAMNACRDLLRQRTRRPGPWLPEPLLEQDTKAAAQLSASAEARYSARESLTVAFLCAAEALNPQQRAVLLLRDVFDFSVRETAEVLELSEANVKTTLHRARAAMGTYDSARVPDDKAYAEASERVLKALFLHVQTRNTAALRSLLRADVTLTNDADDHLFAARRPVIGFDKVSLFLRKIMSLQLRRRAGLPRIAIRILNGQPAMVTLTPSKDPRMPSRGVTWVELDRAGKVARITSQVDPDKLPDALFDNLPPLSPRLLLESLGAAMQATPPRTWLPTLLLESAAAGLASLRRRAR